MPADSPYITVDASDPIARIIINRPERHNALDLSMWKAIPGAVAICMANIDVRAIVLSGAGDRAFVSGADISEFDEVRCDSTTNDVFTQHVVRATASLREARTPVIAAINGYCIGGGVVLASACDIRIASDDATFAIPAAKLGLGYEIENYGALVRLVGHGQAAAMVLTARTFTAEDALRTGLVQQIVPKSELIDYVDTLARDIAKLAPLSLAAAKACSLGAHDTTDRASAKQAIDRCYDSEDFAEGRRAFKDKRRPAFRGK